jgi:ferredoxin
MAAPPRQAPGRDRANPPLASRYVDLRLRVPASAWPVLRGLSVGSFLGLAALPAVRPELGLLLLWGLAVPLLPLVFVVAPGLWRNVCPMAAVNQLPRVSGLTRARPLPRWLRRYGYLGALALFVVLVPARGPLLDRSAWGSAILLLALMSGALAGGLMFKGKSGWCGGLCPLRAVQGLYAQAPVVSVARSHCRPCVGCMKNCPDLKPEDALSGELRDPDPHLVRHRTLTAGVLPGLILGMYVAPAESSGSLPGAYLHFAPLVLASLGSFYALEALTRIGIGRLVATYAAVSFALFYWFNVSIVVSALERLLGLSGPEWLVVLGRQNVLLLAGAFLVRAWRKASQASAPRTPALTIRPGRPGAAGGDGAPRGSARPEPDSTPLPQVPIAPTPAQRRRPQRPLPPVVVTVMPEGTRVEAPAGSTLLELVEREGFAIGAGCRRGACGEDAVLVLEGMDNLSAPDEEELRTLERLGRGRRSRMACSARVRGDVAVALDPRSPAAGQAGSSSRQPSANTADASS